MRRRSLVVELFMHDLRAEDRRFVRRLDDPGLLEVRPRLLAACWAVVRAWDSVGRPGASRMNSSFPRWCEIIGGIVEHAGFACPTASAEIEGVGDTDTRDIAKLAGKLTIGKRYTFAGIADHCAEHGLFERFANDREKDGELTRSAKSAFPKTLRQYDRRVIAAGLTSTSRARERRAATLPSENDHAELLQRRSGLVGMVGMVFGSLGKSAVSSLGSSTIPTMPTTP